MVFNATFNNISVISWRSVLLVEETRGPGLNHRQVTDKLYHIMVYTSPWTKFELKTSVVIGTNCKGSCKSNYHMSTTTTAPESTGSGLNKFDCRNMSKCRWMTTEIQKHIGHYTGISEVQVQNLNVTIVLLTGCFCIGPGIDSRLAVLVPRPVGPRANTADRKSIPGPIQKQPVHSTFIK